MIDRQESQRSTVDRRSFLRLLGASFALAGVGCVPNRDERIVPYVRAPEYVVPGKPLFYATAVEVGGYATGLLVESHEGRPTKVEGNPDHPASLGATDAFAQASVLTLYDPERSQSVSERGEARSWANFVGALRDALAAQQSSDGAGLRILTQTVTSPTLAAQLRALLDEYPQAHWHQCEPVNNDHALAGSRLAFGEPLEARYRVDRAKVILSLDADFLAGAPRNLRYIHDFAEGRRVWPTDPDATEMNRLYVVEGDATLTGAAADHVWPVQAREVAGIARRVAAALGLPVEIPTREQPVALPDDWLDVLVGDLEDNAGESLVIAGDRQPPVVHALAHAMNDALGNVGETVEYTRPVAAEPVEEFASLRELTNAMAAHKVEVLVVVGGNPAYDAPADIDFAGAMEQVPFSAHLSLYRDETSLRSRWHLPEAHYLESWSDTRAYDGSASIVQPLILPLYGGISVHELMAALAGDTEATAYEVVREHWRRDLGANDFEQSWRQSLHAGVISATAFEPQQVSLQPVEEWAGGLDERTDRASLELVFAPDPNIYDGRFANNAWLQELPKPLTKLTWDNAALLSPATAQELGVENEDVVELHYQGRVLRAAVWTVPGHPDRSVTLPLGYGRPSAGGLGTDIGFSAYALRTSGAPWFGGGLEVRRTGERYEFAVTQEHQQMEGHDFVRSAPLEVFFEDADFAHEVPGGIEPDESMYPGFEYPDRAWGMAIDLNACTGCNACVVACQAENNIPVVGKEQVKLGREMHWLRVDVYRGDELGEGAAFQPVPCMHCEQAPCEPVCPVNATVHSDEGLNDMVYNRCIGTRYCSNNCPYKVRRFNFIEYGDFAVESLRALHNPDVTVRSRGVMEKCTYCVQRINAAKVDADVEDRPIRDGEIRTACQQVCPAQAIVFGDINDKDSQVHRMKSSPLNYALLAELNTRPRTTYLAQVGNPHPGLNAR